MKKTEKQYITWIKKHVDEYSKILGLQLVNIEIEKNEDTGFMEILCTYPYVDTKIKFSESSFEKWVNGRLEKDIILHELLHILTDPLYSKALRRFIVQTDIEDERERLTDILTIIIRNLYEVR